MATTNTTAPKATRVLNKLYGMCGWHLVQTNGGWLAYKTADGSP